MAAVLQTTATSTYPTSTAASVYSTSPMMNTISGGGPGSHPAPRYPYFPPMPTHQPQTPFYYQQQNTQLPTYFPYHPPPATSSGIPQPQLQQQPPPSQPMAQPSIEVRNR